MIDLLGCEATGISYNFERRSGHVYMPIGHCTDMDGTIEFFKLFAPDVRHIITWQDGELDTQYVYYGETPANYKWIAI